MPVATLPSGLEIEFREWELDDMWRWAKRAEDGGSEDDVLAEATVPTLVKVVDPGPYGFLKEGATAIDPQRLLKVDVRWWLYRARAASHPDDPARKLTGEDYVFDWECQRDKKHAVEPRKVRLCDLRVKPLPASSLEHLKSGKSLTAKLPSGDVVSFVLPTVGIDKPMRRLMAERTKALRQKQKGARPVQPTLPEAVACQIERISSLGENQSFERKAEYIGKLKLREWEVLKKALQEASPAVKQTVDCPCDECGHVSEVSLPLTPGFFGPSSTEEAMADEPKGEPKATETPVSTSTP